jgi:AAA15 family ATPase/GTPase
MIRKVSFRNFKAYRSLDVELEPLTVLVGPNASGKTTLLQGLRGISVAGSQAGQDDPEFFERLDVQSFGSNSPVELSIAGVWNGIEGSLRMVGERKKSQEEPDSEGLLFSTTGEWNGQRFPIPKARVAGAKLATPLTPPLEDFLEALSSTAVLQFEPTRLAAASYSEDAVPKIHTDGRGLASLLAYLKLSYDEVFSEIELALKQIVPAVRRIRIERAAVEQTAMRTIALDEQKHQVPETRKLWGNQIVLDMKGAKGVPAGAAGEGTLMALGLLAVVLSPEQPKLVLLDDIELALHPAAQGKLIEVIRKIQQQKPDLQIVATSHSPFILNYLDPKEVRMTFLAENGFARCEKLTAHPEFEKWKDLMSPGEFWSTVGENWLEKAGESGAHE